jgi:hypothetical protein
MGRRIDVEADDVFEFLGELRVVRQFERADAMRRELVGFENTNAGSPLRLSPASGRSNELFLSAAARAPGRPLSARCRSAAVVCRACASCCRASAFNAVRHEPGLPSPHHGLGFARAAHDLGGATAVGSGKNQE